MEWYDCTYPEQLVLIATAMSIGIAKNLTTNEVNSLGNFLEMVGQNLLTIAAQRVLYENKCINNITDEQAEDELFGRE